RGRRRGARQGRARRRQAPDRDGRTHQAARALRRDRPLHGRGDRHRAGVGRPGMRPARRGAASAPVLVLGLALGLAAGTPASGQSKKSTTKKKSAAPETVLVRIGNEAITPSVVQRRLDDLPEQVRATFSTPEGRQRLLERMVEERVWLLASQKKGVQDRPEVKRQL